MQYIYVTACSHINMRQKRKDINIIIIAMQNLKRLQSYHLLFCSILVYVIQIF